MAARDAEWRQFFALCSELRAVKNTKGVSGAVEKLQSFLNDDRARQLVHRWRSWGYVLNCLLHVLKEELRAYLSLGQGRKRKTSARPKTPQLRYWHYLRTELETAHAAADGPMLHLDPNGRDCICQLFAFSAAVIDRRTDVELERSFETQVDKEAWLTVEVLVQFRVYCVVLDYKDWENMLELALGSISPALGRDLVGDSATAATRARVTRFLVKNCPFDLTERDVLLRVVQEIENWFEAAKGETTEKDADSLLLVIASTLMETLTDLMTTYFGSMGPWMLKRGVTVLEFIVVSNKPRKNGLRGAPAELLMQFLKLYQHNVAAEPDLCHLPPAKLLREMKKLVHVAMGAEEMNLLMTHFNSAREQRLGNALGIDDQGIRHLACTADIIFYHDCLVSECMQSSGVLTQDEELFDPFAVGSKRPRSITTVLAWETVIEQFLDSPRTDTQTCEQVDMKETIFTPELIRKISATNVDECDSYITGEELNGFGVAFCMLECGLDHLSMPFPQSTERAVALQTEIINLFSDLLSEISSRLPSDGYNPVKGLRVLANSLDVGLVLAALYAGEEGLRSENAPRNEGRLGGSDTSVESPSPALPRPQTGFSSFRGTSRWESTSSRLSASQHQSQSTLKEWDVMDEGEDDDIARDRPPNRVLQKSIALSCFRVILLLKKDSGLSSVKKYVQAIQFDPDFVLAVAVLLCGVTGSDSLEAFVKLIDYAAEEGIRENRTLSATRGGNCRAGIFLAQVLSALLLAGLVHERRKYQHDEQPPAILVKCAKRHLETVAAITSEQSLRVTRKTELQCLEVFFRLNLREFNTFEKACVAGLTDRDVSVRFVAARSLQSVYYMYPDGGEKIFRDFFKVQGSLLDAPSMLNNAIDAVNEAPGDSEDHRRRARRELVDPRLCMGDCLCVLQSLYVSACSSQTALPAVLDACVEMASITVSLYGAGTPSLISEWLIAIADFYGYRNVSDLLDDHFCGLWHQYIAASRRPAPQEEEDSSGWMKNNPLAPLPHGNTLLQQFPLSKLLGKELDANAHRLEFVKKLDMIFPIGVLHNFISGDSADVKGGRFEFVDELVSCFPSNDQSSEGQPEYVVSDIGNQVTTDLFAFSFILLAHPDPALKQLANDMVEVAEERAQVSALTSSHLGHIASKMARFTVWNIIQGNDDELISQSDLWRDALKAMKEKYSEFDWKLINMAELLSEFFVLLLRTELFDPRAVCAVECFKIFVVETRDAVAENPVLQHLLLSICFQSIKHLAVRNRRRIGRVMSLLVRENCECFMTKPDMFGKYLGFVVQEISDILSKCNAQSQRETITVPVGVAVSRQALYLSADDQAELEWVIFAVCNDLGSGLGKYALNIDIVPDGISTSLDKLNALIISSRKIVSSEDSSNAAKHKVIVRPHPTAERHSQAKQQIQMFIQREHARGTKFYNPLPVGGSPSISADKPCSGASAERPAGSYADVRLSAVTTSIDTLRNSSPSTRELYGKLAHTLLYLSSSGTFGSDHCLRERGTANLADALGELGALDARLPHMNDAAYGCMVDVDLLAVARAAVRVNMPYSAMQYLEMWLENHHGGKITSLSSLDNDNIVSTLRDILVEAYSFDSDGDGIYGVNDGRTVKSQLLKYNREDQYANALPLYDISLQFSNQHVLDRDGTASSNTTQLVGGMLASLQSLGYNHLLDGYLQSLDHKRQPTNRSSGLAASQALEHKYKLAWKRMQWEAVLPTILMPQDIWSKLKAGSKTSATDVFSHQQMLFQGLRAVAHGDFRSLQRVTSKAKGQIIQSVQLSLHSFESTKDSYSALVYLQGIHEIEELADFMRKSSPVVDSPILSTVTPTGLKTYSSSLDGALVTSRQKSLTTMPLLERWQRRHGQIKDDFDKAESLLGLEEVLLQVSKATDEAQVLTKLYLDLASLSRKAGRIAVAYRALMKLEQLDERGSLNIYDKMQWQIQKAKLLWKQQEARSAIWTGKKLCSELTAYLDGSSMTGSEATSLQLLHVKVLTITGKWIASLRSESSQVILEDFFQKATNIINGIATEAVSERARDTSKAHFALAEFMAAMYQQVSTRVASREWLAGKKVVNARFEELQELTTLKEHMQNENRAHIHALNKEVKHDVNERSKVEASVDQFLIGALCSYGKGLSLSSQAELDMVFRVLSLWFTNQRKADINRVVIEEVIDMVSSYKFVPLSYQIISRISSSSDTGTFQIALHKLVMKMSVQHPHHTLIQLIALKNSGDVEGKGALQFRTNVGDAKAEGAKVYLAELMKTEQRELLESLDSMANAYVQLALFDTSEYHGQKKKIPLSKVTIFETNSGRSGTAPFDQYLRARTRRGGSTVMPAVLTSHISPEADMDYSNVVRTYSFEPHFSITDSGIHRPKIIYCHGSDGESYKQLVKGHDDTRQDLVIEQVFDTMNQFLMEEKATRKRKLRLRTYRVVPLSPIAGVLEWVENTTPWGSYLVSRTSKKLSAHERYHPHEWKHTECRQYLKNAPEKLPAFLEIQANFTPVFHHFFLERFPDAAVWYHRRLAYVQSTAVTSIVGYILGIGDRHSQNILIHEGTGELVHIDFGVVFDQGMALYTPETVPFRLTRDMVDGMGVSGVDGVFSRCCEVTLQLLRKKSASVVTILEVFVHDPLYRWTLSPLKALRIQEGEEEQDRTKPSVRSRSSSRSNSSKRATGTGNTNETQPADEIHAEPGSADAAARALIRVKQKLEGYEDPNGSALSIEGQVKHLLSVAQDPHNLCKLFPGWAPWL
ncbi:Serine-protein kinase [Phytophthora fragariae]|uniref:non-specific serine/threonine protein kinase n=1 Tax=Phytophthora fragariae TaxID=53985 RepID=A0A6G0LQZ8_9STRA|nr:Serine-protein kinase [Phytophthora fragariae]